MDTYTFTEHVTGIILTKDNDWIKLEPFLMAPVLTVHCLKVSHRRLIILVLLYMFGFPSRTPGFFIFFSLPTSLAKICSALLGHICV